MIVSILRRVLVLGLLIHTASPARADEGDGTSDIIGGRVDNGDRSAVALRDANGDLVCSGTLISPVAVLTAAHCLGYTPASVGFGVSGFDNQVGVSRADAHPNWDGDYEHGNDIAVLSLQAPVPSSVATPSIISAGGEQTPHPDARVRIVGFGQSTPTGGDGIKREVVTSVTSASANSLKIGRSEAQGCYGDSGGPTFFRSSDGVERIVGVFWFMKEDCTDGGTHTRVDAYLPFLYPYLRSFDLLSSKTATGDFDGDGFADQLVLVDHGHASASLLVYPGAATGTASTPYRAWFGDTNSLNVGLSKVTAGDFNGDGTADLIILYDYGPYLGWGSAGLLVIPGTFLRTLGVTAPIELWRAGAGSFDVNLTKIAAGDFNGDRKADLLALYDYSEWSGWASAGLFVFAGTANTELGATAPSEVWQVGQGNFDVNVVEVASGDFNGNRKADLLALYDYSEWGGSGAAGLFVFPGTDSTALNSTSAYEVWYGAANSLDPKASRIAAGDFNADGYADLIGLYDHGSSHGWASAGLFVFPGTPNLSAGSTSFYETWFTGPGNFDVTRTAVGAGDWNRDGYADLIALYDYTSFSWYASELYVFPGTANTGNNATAPYSTSIWELGGATPAL